MPSVRNNKGFPEHFLHTRCIGIMDAVSLVQLAYGLHLVPCQLKVKNTEVRAHPLRLRRTRKNNAAFLHLESKDDLPYVLMIPFCQTQQHGFCEKLLAALPQGCPCLQHNMLLGQQGAQFLLLAVGIELHLIDRGGA